MKAKKCDRCGAFYENYKPTEEQGGANTVLTSYINPNNGQGRTKATFDLCPDCMENQVKFLRNEPVEDEEPSVSPSEPSTSPSDPSEGTDTTQEGNGSPEPSTGSLEGDGEEGSGEDSD